MTEPMRSRGMRDLLPADMRRFRRIETAFRDVCLGWGYAEVRTPTIEHLYLFTAAGTLSPQMLGRVYSFLDWDGWSGERVVLRPDSTIPTARLYAENLRDADVARLFYVQNVLRFSEGDESREDWQCGVELIGDTQPQGDVELILMACETLQRLGLSPELKLSDPGILRALFKQAGLSLEEQTTLYDRVLEGDLSPVDDVQERIGGLKLSLRGLLSMEGEGVDYLNNMRTALSASVPEIAKPLEELASVSRVLAEAGVEHRIAPALVRDFEYYTGPVFHLYAGGTKVGGGGRYDALIGMVAGKDVPASGFALEMDALLPILTEDEARAASEVTIRYSGRNGADLGSAFALARALREGNRSVRIKHGKEKEKGAEVVIGREGFVLHVAGAESGPFTRVEEVVRALSGTTGD